MTPCRQVFLGTNTAKNADFELTIADITNGNMTHKATTGKTLKQEGIVDCFSSFLFQRFLPSLLLQVYYKVSSSSLLQSLECLKGKCMTICTQFHEKTNKQMHASR